MRRFLVRSSLQAESDVLGHYAYFGQGGPDVAERFLDSLERAYERLSLHPMIGVACEGLSPRLDSVRRWGVPGFPNHLIFYREGSGCVEILRILHGARDLEAILTVEPVTFDEGPTS